MTRRIGSLALALAAAATLGLLATPAGAQAPTPTPAPAATTAAARPAGGDATAGAMMNLSKQLGGPGQRVVFTTEKHPLTGDQPEVRLAMEPNSGLESYLAKGAITLESPKINLKCLEMDYRPAQSLIYANGDVAIEKDDLKANGEKLEFKIDTGEFVIEGDPIVEQQSDGNILVFTGMEKFIVRNDAEGRRHIDMEGGDKIRVEVKLPDEPAATPSPDKPKGVSSLGNNVRIQATTAPEKPAAVQATLSPDSAFEGFAASGDVHLTTDDMELKGGKVSYNGVRQVMNAREQVWLKQAEFEATSQALEYNAETGDFHLTGAPDVQQESPNSSMRFSGMESFRVVNQADGRRRVELEKGDAIQVVMQKPQQTGTPNVTDAGTGGMGALGDDVTITSTSRRGTPARVLANMAKDGAFESFDATGAVHLRTPKLELRGDELVYDAPGQRMEASQHVWLKQANIEADAGRMNYDLRTGVIVLTENPEVRQRTDERQLRIWDVDIMTILDRGEGVMDVTYDSTTDGRLPKTEVTSLASGAPMPGATPTPVPTPAPAKVIDLSSPGALPR